MSKLKLCKLSSANEKIEFFGYEIEQCNGRSDNATDETMKKVKSS